MQRRWRSAARGRWLLALLLAPLCVQLASAQSGDVLIIEYADEAVQQAAALHSGGAGTAAHVQAAAAAAAASAAERGAPAARREAIAAIASEAARHTPAVAALTTRIASAALATGTNITGFTNYATVLQGAAVRTQDAHSASRLRQQLESDPAVKSVWVAGTRSLVQPIVSAAASVPGTAAQPSITGTTTSTGLGRVRAELPALDGSGQLVCVIDTGVGFVDNPLYGSCTAVNRPRGRCKVVTGYNFVGEDYIGTRSGPAPQPGSSPPTDCFGHGSMVASVAGTRNGVAPGAMLGSYRVFGCSGYVGDNIVVEAIDRAVRDGCDIINLSLASESGYAQNSLYTRVMQNALDKGVLVVKAAGNSGTEGPWRADVYTAVGAITVASVDVSAHASRDAASRMSMSQFSSMGPAPTLELLPHVAAPGDEILVRDRSGARDRASGTSFASPYISGILALWLQHKQLLAGGAPLEPGSVNQDAAMRGLVATAKGVKDPVNPKFNEPVAWMGAGVVQADAFLHNQVSLSPLMVQLPSALAAPSTHAISVAWDGPPTPGGAITYRLVHEPSSSITLNNGWYGIAAMRKEYVAASVVFSAERITLDTSSRGATASARVTFRLPPALAQQALLYSGLIKLVPEAAEGVAHVSALTVPYQGYSAQLAHIRLQASPSEGISFESATLLRDYSNALCSSPWQRPQFLNDVMDHLATVPGVCTGGLATSDDDVLRVSADVLRSSPECSLRVTLAPEVPLHTLLVDVTDGDGQLLGSLAPLDLASGGGLAKLASVMSFCLRFDGSFRDAAGVQHSVVPGRTYGLRAHLKGPVAAADAARIAPRITTVPIRGRFEVVATGPSDSGSPAAPPAEHEHEREQQHTRSRGRGRGRGREHAS